LRVDPHPTKGAKIEAEPALAPQKAGKAPAQSKGDEAHAGPHAAKSTLPPSGVAAPKEDAENDEQPKPASLEPVKPGKSLHGSGHRSRASNPPPKKVRPVRPVPPNATWLKYRRAPWRRGYATLFGHGKKWEGYLVDAEGEVLPSTRRSLSAVLASWRTGREVLIDPRLIGLIADVSDEFGGRPVRIVSGYRESSHAPDSKHKVGQAFDFSVPGVPNELVRDFLRSLPDVGVGYYPNSTHVHLDVRDKPTYWVDYSRPGQPPLYAWDRRVAGMSPAERALAAALDELAHRPTFSAGGPPHATAMTSASSARAFAAEPSRAPRRAEESMPRALSAKVEPDAGPVERDPGVIAPSSAGGDAAASAADAGTAAAFPGTAAASTLSLRR